MRGNLPDRSAVGHTRSGRAAPQNRHSAMKSLMRPDQSTRSAQAAQSHRAAPRRHACAVAGRGERRPCLCDDLGCGFGCIRRVDRRAGHVNWSAGRPMPRIPVSRGAQTHSQRTLRRTACAIHRDAHRNSDHWRSYRRGGTTRRAAAELRPLGPSARTSQASCPCLRLDALDIQVVWVLTRWLKRLQIKESAMSDLGGKCLKRFNFSTPPPSKKSLY